MYKEKLLFTVNFIRNRCVIDAFGGVFVFSL